MKSSKIVGWIALANVSLLLACGGSSSIGSSAGAEAGTSAGGSKAGNFAGASVTAKGGAGTVSMGGMPGTVTMGGMPGTATMGGMPGTATMGGMPGTVSMGGMPGTVTMPQAGAGSIIGCMRDEECPGYGEPCQMCTKAFFACNQGYCDAETKRCFRVGGICSPQCADDRDCPAPELACTGCSDGSQACPTSQCLMGFCQASYPGCAGFDPCKGLECGSICRSCPPGEPCDETVLSFCNHRGACSPGPNNCGKLLCRTTMDCATPPPTCVRCADGSCASYECVDNECSPLDCPGSNFKCKYTAECPSVHDGQCTLCPNGKCAVPACIQDACALVCPVE